MFGFIKDNPLLATIAVLAATAAYAGVTGDFSARAVAEHDDRRHCYLVAYERLERPWVGRPAASQNSHVCVSGQPGTRQVISAIQSQLQTQMRASSVPAAAVIHKIHLSEEI